jgi:hypothetical protein
MEHLKTLSSRDRAKGFIELHWDFVGDIIDVMIDDSERVYQARWDNTGSKGSYILKL